MGRLDSAHIEGNTVGFAFSYCFNRFAPHNRVDIACLEEEINWPTERYA
jgi:hypothetical protein